MTNPTSRADVHKTFDAIQAEGQGVWAFRFETAWELVRTAMAGDARAEDVVLALGQMRDDARTAPAAERPLCLLCDRSFTAERGPSLVCTVTAYVDNPGAIIVHGICGSCASHGLRTLEHRVAAYYRKNVSAEMREVDLHDAVGHA